MTSFKKPPFWLVFYLINSDNTAQSAILGFIFVVINLIIGLTNFTYSKQDIIDI